MTHSWSFGWFGPVSFAVYSVHHPPTTVLGNISSHQTIHKTQNDCEQTIKENPQTSIQYKLICFFWFVQTGLIMASWHCLYFSSLNTYKKKKIFLCTVKSCIMQIYQRFLKMMCLLPVSELSRNKVQVQPWHSLVPFLREHSPNTHFWKSAFCDITLTSLKYLAG